MLLVPRHGITCQFGFEMGAKQYCSNHLGWCQKNTILPVFLTELLAGVWDSKCRPGDDPKNYRGLVIMTPYRQHVCVCVCVSLALKVKMHTMFVSAGNKLQWTISELHKQLHKIDFESLLVCCWCRKKIVFQSLPPVKDLFYFLVLQLNVRASLRRMMQSLRALFVFIAESANCVCARWKYHFKRQRRAHEQDLWHLKRFGVFQSVMWKLEASCAQTRRMDIKVK